MTQDCFGLSTHVLASVEPQRHFPLFAAHGFRLLELGLSYYPWLADAERCTRLRELAERSGLRVSSFHMPYGNTVPEAGFLDLSHPDPDVRDDTLAAVQLCAGRLAELGGRFLVIHPSVRRREEASRAEGLALLVDSVRRCVQLLDAHGRRGRLQIALELLPPGSLLHEARDVEAVLEPLTGLPVGLCLDVNHVNLSGDLLECIRATAGSVLTTHLSDNDGVRERHWLPGRGVIPWPDVLAALHGGGYSGPLIYETSQEPGVGDADTVVALRRVTDRLAAGLPPTDPADRSSG